MEAPVYRNRSSIAGNFLDPIVQQWPKLSYEAMRRPIWANFAETSKTAQQHKSLDAGGRHDECLNHLGKSGGIQVANAT